MTGPGPARTRLIPCQGRVTEAASRLGYGELDTITISPSRNVFHTDHEHVFVKQSADALDAEFLAAHHARRYGIETPAPLSVPTTVDLDCAHDDCPRSVDLLPFRYHAPHGAPVTSVEAARALIEVWELPAMARPGGVADWTRIVDRAHVNLAHVADKRDVVTIAAIVESAAANVDERLRSGVRLRHVHSHGDFHSRNVLRSVSGVMVLDWELADTWWPEADAAKYLQTMIAERTHPGDRHASDLDVDGFLSTLGERIDLGLTDALVRLRAACAAAYQTRFAVSRPLWTSACLLLADHGLAGESAVGDLYAGAGRIAS